MKDEWKIVKFGEIARNISERVDPLTTDLDVYVGLEHLDPQSLRITRRGVPADVKGQKLRVRPGQIIFGKRRAYQKKVAVADFNGICSAHAMVLEPVPGKIIPELLPFFMQSDMFMDRAVAISEGSLSPTIKWKTLAIQEFPLPPLERQKEILEVLDKVEKNICIVQEALKSSKKFIRRLLQNLLLTNAECKLGDISEIISGQHIIADNYNGNDIGMPYLTGPDDFPDGYIQVSKFTNKPKVICKNGDILLTVKGSGVGKSIIANAEYCISRQLMAIRGKQFDTKYLSLVVRLMSDEINRLSSGVIPGISKAGISNFKIADPKSTNIENIVETISKADNLDGLLSEKLKIMIGLRNRISNQAIFRKGS